MDIGLQAVRPLRMLVALTLVAATGSANAAWPERPVRIVVPLPAGTAPDLVARFLGQKFAEVVKQPIVIENRPGANGVIGAGLVAKATPDGYTLLQVTSQHVMLKHLVSPLTFDPIADFAPVITTTATEMVLIVGPASKFATARALVDHARAQPDGLTYGTPGIGSPAHMAVSAFNRAIGIATRHIPYKGSTESVTATVGGQVDFTITSIFNALPLIQSGKARPLAFASAERNGKLPQVPTMAEAVPPGFVYETWGALLAPARTPREVLLRINRELGTIMRSAEGREFFDRNGARSAPRSLEDATTFFRAQAAEAAGLVQAFGATAR
jgi:tripartite-type tricarboxylate transporter receptor subunit TctC